MRCNHRYKSGKLADDKVWRLKDRAGEAEPFLMLTEAENLEPDAHPLGDALLSQAVEAYPSSSTGSASLLINCVALRPGPWSTKATGAPVAWFASRARRSPARAFGGSLAPVHHVVGRVSSRARDGASRQRPP
jgi:hypothetical protein